VISKLFKARLSRFQSSLSISALPDFLGGDRHPSYIVLGVLYESFIHPLTIPSQPCHPPEIGGACWHLMAARP